MTHRVDPDHFTPASTLAEQQAALDARGLRATGSPQHAAYIDDLAERLTRAGVNDVRTEAVPMRRWTPDSWSLSVEGTGIPVISPVSYSGSTGPDGVTVPLSTAPAAGTIGVVTVGLAPLRAGIFDRLDWDAPHLPDHPEGYDPAELYERVWLSQEPMREHLARFKAAGALGLVIAVDVPAAELPSAYLLYDGVHREFPALFVGRDEGEQLMNAARLGKQATLVLDARVDPVDTHNILGLIPGATDELVVLHSHTDGPNGLEDNGPEAIIAMAEYLAALPQGELPRSILVLLSTGHFAIEEAWGVPAFLAQHAGDLVPRIATAVTLEHLGALPSPAGRSDHVDHEYEFGCVFSTGHRALIDAMRHALTEAGVTESRVIRPFVPDLTGLSPDGTTWPGDGCAFWQIGGLPSANFITGPGYLLNVEPVAEFIDAEALRRQAIAFTDALLELAAAPWGELHTAPLPNAPVALA